jgi:hypothetical protein
MADDSYASFQDAPAADPYAQFADHPGSTATSTRGASQPAYTFSDYLKSFGSAAVRPVIKAVTSLPAMAADTGVAFRNLGYNLSHGIMPTVADFNPLAKTGGSHQEYELPSQSFNRVLDQYTQAPTTGLGKGAELASTVLLGSQLPSPQVVNNVPQNFVPLSQNVLRTYAQDQPVTAQVSGGGSTFGRIGADPSAGLNGAQQRAATLGEQLGFRLTPGQAAGSRSLQQFEAKLESQPFTSGPFNTLKSGNQTALNRQWAAAIGENSPTLDSSVLERANERIGDVFNSMRNPNRIVQADPAGTSRVLDAVDSRFEGLLPNNASIRTNPLVSRLESLTNTGTINGEQLGDLSSKLGRAAYKQMTTQGGDRELGQALYSVKDHVDDLVSQTLQPAEQGAFATARQQYRALMQLTSRVGNVNPSTGNVSGGSIANYLQQTDRQGFLFGNNQSNAYNAARFAQAFKPIVGDSGTATRSMLTSPTDMLLSIPGNIAARAYLSPAGMAAAPAVVNAAGDLPVAIQRVPSWLLTRGLPGLAAGMEPSTAGQ